MVPFSHKASTRARFSILRWDEAFPSFVGSCSLPDSRKNPTPTDLYKPTSGFSWWYSGLVAKIYGLKPNVSHNFAPKSDCCPPKRDPKLEIGLKVEVEPLNVTANLLEGH